MCSNGKGWCKGPGFFDPSKICLQCKSASAAHEGMALTKPQPASFPGASEAMATASVLPSSTTVGSGLIAAPTLQRVSSGPKPVVPVKPKSLRLPVPDDSSSSAATSTDPYARLEDETEARWEMRVMAMRKRKATSVPETYTGYVYRGEDSAKGGKPGRTPAELFGHGGFLPWQSKSVADSRRNVVTLASGPSALSDRAYLWQKNKDRADGFFVSTGTNAGDAYDNYEFFYRARIPTLTKRDWDAVGIADFNPDNVRECHLFTDASTIAASTCIGVLCLREEARIYELLVMTPLPPGEIEVKQGMGWTALKTAAGKA